MFVFKAAVVGAGTMGAQIAQVIAAAGVPVVLRDVRAELVDAGVAEASRVTEKQVAKLVEQDRLTREEADRRLAEVLGRLHPTTTYEGFGDVDLVIEAVPERVELKQAVFAELDAVTPGHAILATNTSGLSISEIALATLRPEKVIGFHLFYPASVMPLVEVVEGEETSAETLQAAVTFAQAIRKTPITCGEAPGFVVNRILNSAIAEIWREQEDKGLSIRAIDDGLVSAGVMPTGPYRLVDLLGLDTVVHVAEHLHAEYDLVHEGHGHPHDARYVVPDAIVELVEEGRLGAKTGGDGVYALDGTANLPGDAEPDVAELAELVVLKSLHEACLLLEEGVATHRDIDVGMTAGAGYDPRRGLLPPFRRADAEGLGVVLERLERAQERYGDRFAPPTVLRRLVAQGRLGPATGQGFYPYPRPDAEQPAGEQAVVTLESRGDVAIAWLANGAMNAISPQVVADLRAVWDAVQDGPVRALVLASANPLVFSAGADLKAFGRMDASAAAALAEQAHALLRSFETSRVVTIAAINGLAFGGGNEVAMAADVRIAAQSALLGQPEVKLGIIPGFGGTQRLARLAGAAKALELNLVGDPISALDARDLGLVNRVVVDHELLDTALAWARRLAAQALVAVGLVKEVSARADLDDGLAAEQVAFAAAFASEDAREGIDAFLAKRDPVWRGR